MKQIDSWPIRAVQMDLARQKETLAEIKRFMTLAKEHHYNTVFLYLEGVVRTQSFPSSAGHFYTPGEVRQMVKYASELGLEVIPCVATLGHAEHFLACKELQHLRETGFWYQNMFCPSEEEVYTFLEKYIAEIAALFPGPHFHIGCDEAWALGACPTCRKRVSNGESREDLLIAHIRRVHRFVTALGKRVWIWDDMFEGGPDEKFAELPRDIVMCSWHYNPELISLDGFQGHFNNLKRRDKFTLYEQLGFDVVVCPNGKGIQNIIANTEVAAGKRVLGGLLTMWELTSIFLPRLFPAVALAGELWSCPSQEPATVFAATLSRLFPAADELELEALGSACERPFWRNVPAKEYLRGALSSEERRHLAALRTYASLITRYIERLLPSREREIAEQLLLGLHLQIVAGRQREILPQLIEPRLSCAKRSRLQAQAYECADELGRLAALFAKHWKHFRPNIEPDLASKNLFALEEGLRAFIDQQKSLPEQQRAVLHLRLTLEDAFSAPKLVLRLQKGEEWAEVFSGTCKPVNLRDGLYELQVPLCWNGQEPRQLEIVVSGYGGQGVSYAWLVLADRVFTPEAIVSESGAVLRAEMLLRDDSSSCFFGDADTVKTLNLFQHAEEASTVVRLGVRKSAGVHKPGSHA